MNVEDVRAQLEQDLSWRNDELRLLGNQMHSLRGKQEKERFCRALLLMLYAHVEGFTKSAMRIYVQAVVSENLNVRSLNSQLGANSLNLVITAVENATEHSFFTQDPPPKQKLTRIYRVREILSKWHGIQDLEFSPDIDEITDTDSNLKRNVLRKLLFRAGLNVDEFQEFEDDLDSLVSRRNPIAHGEIATLVRVEDYIRLETSGLMFMDALVRSLTLSLIEKRYLADVDRLCPVI
jgi:hypothetical protein